jgi:CheY-like chemotaxis protein
VVDDHLEAGYLLSRLLRRGGYEVAELHDLDAVVETLTELDGSVAAIVATFTHAGTAASLHLLDALRNHVDPRLSSPRILLTADESRQQIFCLQAGADAVLLRPFTDVELTEAVDRMMARPERDRAAYRRIVIQRIKSENSSPLGEPVPWEPDDTLETPTGTSSYF